MKVGSSKQLEVEETMPVLARKENEEEGIQIQLKQQKKISQNQCQIKGHKGADLMYLCTTPGCDHLLLCKKCKKQHNKDHLEMIKLLDEWFNNMFGRKVADSDNNKVSRKCGMNLGKLNELLKELQIKIEERKATIEAQTQQFQKRVTEYINKKKQECFKRLESNYDAKSSFLEEQNATYKKLKSLNRFTILENLKRQHDPNGNTPPKIPIESIIRFLIQNENQLSDSSQIETHHKGFSKLVRDTESLEQQILNDSKVFSKLTTTEEGKHDYLAKDSPITHRIEDYIDFLFTFEKGLPKKASSFFRSGTLSMEEDDLFQSQQLLASSSNINFSNQCQRISSKQNGGSKPSHFQQKGEKQQPRRRLTLEQVLQHSQLPQQQSQSQSIQFNSPQLSNLNSQMYTQQSSQTNLLKQLQDQDKDEFFMLKRHESSDDDEQEEIDYECELQENFNSAQFVDFTKDSIRVFSDQAVQLYSLKSNSFNKNDSLYAQQKVIVKDQEMYEVGAIEEVPFFADQDPIENLLQETVKRLQQDQIKEQENQQAETCNPSFPSSSSSSFYSASPPDSPRQKQKLPLLIIGLKSDPAKIEIWDMNNNEKVSEQPSAHDCSITCIKVLEVKHQKSVLFAVGSYDGLIKIWSLERITQESTSDQTQTQFKYILSSQYSLKGHKDFVTCMILFMIKDDPLKNYLISSGSDKKIILWDWKSKESNGLEVSTAGNSEKQKEEIKKESKDEEVKDKKNEAENLEKKQEAKPKPMLFKRQIKIMSMKPSSDSNTASGSAASSNSNPNSQIVKIQEKLPLKVMENVHTDKINCFEILEEGLLASGSSDNTIKIWDMDTQQQQKSLQNKFIVNNICKLRRGQLVCTANNVKMNIYLINIWNWEQGQIIGVIKGHTGRITKLHVLPSYQNITKTSFTIVTCERNKVIRIWKDTKAQQREEEEEMYNKYQEENLNSPNSMQSFANRGFFNPAEEFFHNYHIEIDPSLTPRYINMARIASSTTIIPPGGYDKTPINAFIKGQGFSSLSSQMSQQQLQQPQYLSSQIPQNFQQQIYFSEQDSKDQSLQYHNQQNSISQMPIVQVIGVNGIPQSSIQQQKSGKRTSIEEHFGDFLMNSTNNSGSISPGLHKNFMSTLNAQLAAQVFQQQQSQLQQQQQSLQNSTQQQFLSSNSGISRGFSSINSIEGNYQGGRKKPYQEVGNMLAPLEEANESCWNSPMGSLNEVFQEKQLLNKQNLLKTRTTSIDNFQIVEETDMNQELESISIEDLSQKIQENQKEIPKSEDNPSILIDSKPKRNGLLKKSKEFKFHPKILLNSQDDKKEEISNQEGNLEKQNDDNDDGNSQQILQPNKITNNLNNFNEPSPFIKIVPSSFEGEQFTNTVQSFSSQNDAVQQEKSQNQQIVKITSLSLKEMHQKEVKTLFKGFDNLQSDQMAINSPIITQIQSEIPSPIQQDSNLLNPEQLSDKSQENQKQESIPLSQNPPTPLLKARGALQKSSKASRNIFQN